MKNYMDNSIRYTPEAIQASIKEFYEHMKNDTQLFKDVKH